MQQYCAFHVTLASIPVFQVDKYVQNASIILLQTPADNLIAYHAAQVQWRTMARPIARPVDQARMHHIMTA